jgi:hypothetical protein
MVFSSVLEPSYCLPGVLFDSQAFLVMRWPMPGRIMREVALVCLYLVTKPSHMGG